MMFLPASLRNKESGTVDFISHHCLSYCTASFLSCFAKVSHL